jgi:hypothetical protein
MGATTTNGTTTAEEVDEDVAAATPNVVDGEVEATTTSPNAQNATIVGSRVIRKSNVSTASSTPYSRLHREHWLKYRRASRTHMTVGRSPKH